MTVVYKFILVFVTFLYILITLYIFAEVLLCKDSELFLNRNVFKTVMVDT